MRVKAKKRGIQINAVLTRLSGWEVGVTTGSGVKEVSSQGRGFLLPLSLWGVGV
jgi:hypothetical protein